MWSRGPAPEMRTWMSAGKLVRRPREATLSVSREHMMRSRDDSGRKTNGEDEDKAQANWYVTMVLICYALESVALLTMVPRSRSLVMH
jgi:hypothetical protein